MRLHFFKAKSLPDFIGRVSIEIVANERRKPNSRVVCWRRKIAVGGAIIFLRFFAFDEVQKYAKRNGHISSPVVLCLVSIKNVSLSKKQYSTISLTSKWAQLFLFILIQSWKAKKIQFYLYRLVASVFYKHCYRMFSIKYLMICEFQILT